MAVSPTHAASTTWPGAEVGPCGGHHDVDRSTSAEHGGGFGHPDRALVSFRAGFVFGVAGFQVRLLRQL